MSSHLPPIALTRWLLKRSRVNHRGFTLTELLVAIVVSSLIIGSLLYLVVELLGTNVREEKLTQAQQDTKRALDYISRDVREAVYVYSTPTDLVDNELTDVPAGTPVLAFWRLKPIDVGELPADCSTTTEEEECETLKVRQNVYDLVVYLHRDNTDNPLWSGPSRIIRYELTNYSDLSDLTPTDGYSDPSKPGNSFLEWERDGTETDGNSVVLTDFIDNHAGSVTINCPTGLRRSPAANSDNFFVCIRDSAVSGNTLNQSLSVFLRGSIVDPGVSTVIFGPTSQASRLPVLNTEVQVRGVIEKSN